MEEPKILLDTVRYKSADVERGASGAPETASGALIIGGVIGLIGTAADRRLTKGERLAALGGSVACVALGLFARRRPVPLMVPARSAPAPAAGACYAAAIVATSAGGGHRSPAYFPAVLLTAVGSAIAANGRGAAAATGTAVAAAYLAGCARTIVADEVSPREMWSTASYACGFLGAGVVGAVAGELTLSARVLSDYAERDAIATRSGAGRDELDRAAARVRATSTTFMSVLPRIDAMFEAQPEVAASTDALATALASLKAADLHLGACEHISAIGSWDRLRDAIANYRGEPGDVTATLALRIHDRRAIDAATTGAVLDCVVPLIQNAANARAGKPDPVRATISVERVPRSGNGHHDELLVVVEDDAGGRPIPQSEWGEGLWSCERTATEHGGSFRLAAGAAGLRAELSLPYISSRTRGARRRTYAAEYDAGRDSALRALRGVTACQAAFLLLYRGTNIARATALLGGLLVAGELAERLPAAHRPRANATLAAIAMSAFGGRERPPMGGWAAVMCASAAARGGVIPAYLAAGAGWLATTWRGGSERFGADLAITAVDRIFPFVGVGSGSIIFHGLTALRAQEDRLGTAVWRRKLLLDLAAPALASHHFLGPLERAIGQISPSSLQDFRTSALGAELYASQAKVMKAQGELKRLLEAGEPLAALQHQLARLLQPASVIVLGARPVYTIPPTGREIDAVGYRLALIGLGQAIAETVRLNLPPKILGRARLREVRLVLHPDDERTRIEIIQVPFAAGDRDQQNATLDAAARDAGGRALLSSNERNTVYIHNSALQ